MCRLTTPNEYLDCVVHSHSMERTPQTSLWLRDFDGMLREEIVRILQLPEGYAPVNTGLRIRGIGLNHHCRESYIVPLPRTIPPILAAEVLRTSLPLIPEVSRLHPRIHLLRGGKLVFFVVAPAEKEVGEIRFEIHLVSEIKSKPFPRSGKIELDGTSIHLRRRMDLFTNLPVAQRPIFLALQVWVKTMEGFPIQWDGFEMIVRSLIQSYMNHWDQLKAILRQLADGRTRMQFPDPGHPTRHFPGLPNRGQKQALAELARNTLDKIEMNPNRLREFFPSHAPFCMEARYQPQH